jgi:hypothetical protein
MKSFSKTLLCIPILFVSIASSCKKDKNESDGLPPLTFEGKNTIGCKINGVPWVPKGKFGGGVAIYPTSGGYYGDPFFPGRHILIKTNDPDSYINLFCRNYAGDGYIPPGKYNLDRSTQVFPFGYGEIHSYGHLNFNGKDYVTDSLHTGWIEILKSDTLKGIVSGRFEFTAYNPTDGKTYHITEGRFDYKTH